MSTFTPRSYFKCGGLFGDMFQWCTCVRCRRNYMDEVCSVCCFGDGDSFTYDPNPNSFNDSPNFSDYPPQPQYQTYSCELCGNDAYYGYDCPPQVTFIYNKDACFNQNFDNNNFPQTSPSFPQQYLCCENCDGPHESFQCQPMNQNYYEPNPCYNSNSFGFDQFQPSQYSVVHQPPYETSTEMLQAGENLMEAIQAFLKKYDQIPPKEKSMALLLAEERFLKIKQALEEEKNQPENIQELILKLINDLQILNGIQLKQEEQAAKVSSQYWKPPIFYDDDDEESSIPLRDIISELPMSVAITPDLPITDSLIMEDEHLNTISETDMDEENESSVKDLNLTPSESEDLFDNESECDVPVCDDSSPNFMTFSNPLFDSNDDFTSSDDESFSEEDVPKENFKIYSNPLFEFDEEIISSKIDTLYNEINSIPQENDNDHFNAEFDLIESFLNRDTSMVFSPKIDSLLEEFSGELAHIDLIPPGIDEADFDPEEDIHSDSLIEEIDIFLASDDSIPPGIENDDYDSEGDVLFLKELLNDDSISLPKYESFHVDFYNVPSSLRPPEKPPDDDVYFDIEPDTGVLTTKVVDDISDNSTRELYVHVPNVLPTFPTLYPVFDTLLSFLSENEDKVFNPGILISKEEKSHHLLSHRGFKVFQLINDSESPMMIYGGYIPILDVPYLHFYPP
ncbi:hypothetical protein Tco_0822728 [Tanacetum coccineum]|uniref:Uncharacterized protein n=1 Tax=Tanacetum coccineum TaxID=301880 RepID=A0ABQ5AKF4_9ASTR